MTDRKLNNLARAGAFAFVVILALLAFIGAAFGQDVSTTDVQNTGRNTGNHSHDKDDFERFALLRLLPPAKITNVEPNEFGTRIEYVITDRRQVRNGSFQIAKGTQAPPEPIKKGRYYWILYCSADEFLVTIVPVGKDQFK
jgi:hypothetical protein